MYLHSDIVIRNADARHSEIKEYTETITIPTHTRA